MSDNQPITDMQRIAAFADGELSGQDNLHLLEQSQHDPQVALRIRHQQQLRRACCQAMREPRSCPEALKQQLMQMAADAERKQQQAQDARPAVLARIGRWAPAAVAALLLLAAVSIYQATPRQNTSFSQHVLPVKQVDQFESRHETCSRSISELIRDPNLPNDLSQLPAKLQEKLGQPLPALDLSSLGYKFLAIGLCTIPGDNAVHLIYKADPATGRHDAISLWLRADDGKLNIESGHIYASAGSQPDEKMLVWRHGGMIFYLLGDDPSQLEHVAKAL